MTDQQPSQYPRYTIVAGTHSGADALAELHGLDPLEYSTVIDPDEDEATIFQLPA